MAFDTQVQRTYSDPTACAGKAASSRLPATAPSEAKARCTCKSGRILRLTCEDLWSIPWIAVHILMRDGMVKTIQMTIDEPLLSEVDRVIQSLDTTRSAFIREALQLAL